MTKRAVNSEHLYSLDPPWYSHIVVVDYSDLAFISGQLSRDHSGDVVGEGDMHVQVSTVMGNLQRAVRSVGLEMEDIVQTRTFTTDMDKFLEERDTFLSLFDREAFPASTAVEVRRLSRPEFLVEVDAVAALRAKATSPHS